MANISNNGIIVVNRGDSFTLPIVLNLGTSVLHDIYELTPDDTLYIGIMEPNQPFETAIVRKKFTYEEVDEDGNINVFFRPEDTACLLPGKYYYQVKMETIINNVTYVETVIDKTLFYIKE